MLFAFFITSVALSFAGRARKRQLVDIAKGGPRDGRQVLANGGIATLCAVAAIFVHDAALFYAFAGAYAAATADTWSTEVGSPYGGTPRSIVSFAPLARGISGGVTLLGSLAMLAGAAWIGYVAGGFWIVAAAGVTGALLDSLLGATLQSMRYCFTCRRTTELYVHVCGTFAEPARGLRWMTNDAVNALATLAGAAVAAGLFLFLPR